VAALQRILDEAWDDDIRYFTNQDIDIHPRADQWSNGVNVAVELDRMMEVRRAALSRFGENAIKRNMPMATIEEVLVPLYMHHRFQVSAAASAIGGVDYVYALRGDGRTPTQPAAGDLQRASLRSLMATLDLSALTIPSNVIAAIPPRPSGYGRHRELFPRYTSQMFDVVTPAAVAANHTVSSILTSARAARIVEQHAVDPSLPSLDEVIDHLMGASFGSRAANGYEAEVKRAVERVVIENLMRLATSATMPQVRAIASYRLELQQPELSAAMAADGADAAHYVLLSRDIERFLTRPSEAFSQPAPGAAPPGAPIGEPAMNWLAGWDYVCTGEWW
jgi:hypothetical protein